MSESPVETLQKALGLHFISKRGLTCLWQLKSHVEFTASDVDDAWQFFNIVRKPNITVSNRKIDLNSHLNSRSVCIVLPCIVYIPELSLIPRQVSWLRWTTRVSNCHPDVTREYAPGACRNSRKLMRLPPRCKMRPDSPAFHAEEFHFPKQTRKEPRIPWRNWRVSPRTLSQQEKDTDVTSRMQNRLVYPKSTQDEAHFPFIVSIAILHSTSYTTSGLTSFTTMQRFPETPISSL